MSDKLKEIRERCEAIQPLPYKKFPIAPIVEGDPEQTSMINCYLDFGLHSRIDIPKLLDALEVALEAIDFYRSEKSWFAGGIEGDSEKYDSEMGDKARSALEKINRILKGEERT